MSVTDDAVTLTLSPAINRGEVEALAALCERIEARQLVLPGDPKRRVLRLRVHS